MGADMITIIVGAISLVVTLFTSYVFKSAVSNDKEITKLQEQLKNIQNTFSKFSEIERSQISLGANMAHLQEKLTDLAKKGDLHTNDIIPLMNDYYKHLDDITTAVSDLKFRVKDQSLRVDGIVKFLKGHKVV